MQGSHEPNDVPPREPAPAASLSHLLAARAEGIAPDDRELWPVVYAELRRIAGRHLGRERSNHTLDATALVHEVWLAVGEDLYEGKARRDEVLAYASRAMRSLLVDHARRKKSRKRGGDAAQVTLRESLDAADTGALDVMELDDALRQLTEIDPELGRIAELHLFGGLSHREVAEVTGLAERTLERRWKVASTWLRKELGS